MVQSAPARSNPRGHPPLQQPTRLLRAAPLGPRGAPPPLGCRRGRRRGSTACPSSPPHHPGGAYLKPPSKHGAVLAAGDLAKGRSYPWAALLCGAGTVAAVESAVQLVDWMAAAGVPFVYHVVLYAGRLTAAQRAPIDDALFAINVAAYAALALRCWPCAPARATRERIKALFLHFVLTFALQVRCTRAAMCAARALHVRCYVRCVCTCAAHCTCAASAPSPPAQRRRLPRCRCQSSRWPLADLRCSPRPRGSWPGAGPRCGSSTSSASSPREPSDPGATRATPTAAKARSIAMHPMRVHACARVCTRAHCTRRACTAPGEAATHCAAGCIPTYCQVRRAVRLPRSAAPDDPPRQLAPRHGQSATRPPTAPRSPLACARLPLGAREARSRRLGADERLLRGLAPWWLPKIADSTAFDPSDSASSSTAGTSPSLSPRLRPPCCPMCSELRSGCNTGCSSRRALLGARGSWWPEASSVCGAGLNPAPASRGWSRLFLPK